MTSTTLHARDLVKVFDDGTRALDGVSLQASAGEVLTLLGPSGCGKSTLLRIVAGLEQPSSGQLEYDGASLLDVPAGERRVGFVFQNYALYPHLSVAGNLGLAMEVRKVPREERERRVRETAELLGLSRLLDRRPAQLSGGQQQRVALGRALVREPKLYLLDEPLSNLDALLRESMRAELKTLFARVNAIVMYVTHDQAEAMSLSDRVAVMRDGRILQVAAPLELYRRPADLFVATFVGSPRMTVWRGSTGRRRARCGGRAGAHGTVGRLERHVRRDSPRGRAGIRSRGGRGDPREAPRERTARFEYLAHTGNRRRDGQGSRRAA